MTSTSFSAQRVAVCGDSRVGKTWLVKALKGDHTGAAFLVGHSYQPTVGVQASSCLALGPAVVAWDIGGASSAETLSDTHVDRASALVVLFDPSRCGRTSKYLT